MKKKNKKPPEPLVTSIAAVMDAAQDTRPFTADEVRADKREMHTVLKEALSQFATKLKRREIELNSTIDLERIVKAALLVMGEPEGVPQSTQQAVVTFSEPLSLDDPDVKSVYERLTSAINDRNDQA